MLPLRAGWGVCCVACDVGCTTICPIAISQYHSMSQCLNVSILYTNDMDTFDEFVVSNTIKIKMFTMSMPK